MSRNVGYVLRPSKKEDGGRIRQNGSMNDTDFLATADFAMNTWEAVFIQEAYAHVSSHPEPTYVIG